ncbi:MAG: GDSL-type esterase/lipase family protein [Tepidisphaeraceae bacterium]
MQSFLTSFVLAGLSFAASALGAATEPTTKPVRLTIALVGDSTVTDHAGWGPGFASSLADDVRCVNFSASGRSSKSFRDEGKWKPVLELKPDYVLIQFGHNDQPGKGPERETDPKTTFRENMARYVDEARDAGIKPIIVTSIARGASTPAASTRRRT